VATGSLAIDDDLDNGAILTVAGMVPGDTAPGAVTISNVGESAGDFTLGQTDLVDTPGPSGGNLSSVLQLQVKMDGTTVVYDGLFSGLSSVDLGSWEPAESHTFDFVVTFPEGDDDDQYQQSQVTTTYIWNAVSG
jgi:hypothetical protein